MKVPALAVPLERRLSPGRVVTLATLSSCSADSENEPERVRQRVGERVAERPAYWYVPREHGCHSSTAASATRLLGATSR
jgi:hypothetical protein